MVGPRAREFVLFNLNYQKYIRVRGHGYNLIKSGRDRHIQPYQKCKGWEVMPVKGGRGGISIPIKSDRVNPYTSERDIE